MNPHFSQAPPAQQTGTCPVCAATAALNPGGTVGQHRQMRVRTGTDGRPEHYVSGSRCDGENEQPDSQ